MVRPQWFSRASITPSFSAVGRQASIDFTHQSIASSCVWPGSGGSSPFTFMRSSKDWMVFHRPELSRTHGIPSCAASSRQCFVWSTCFWRSAGSGCTKSWWIESMGSERPARKAAFLRPFT